MIFKITDRLITQTLADPTASGRTDQWQSIIDAVTQMNLPTLIRQFFFGKIQQQHLAEKDCLISLLYLACHAL